MLIFFIREKKYMLCVKPETKERSISNVFVTLLSHFKQLFPVPSFREWQGALIGVCPIGLRQAISVR
jgi:hypothetical protein